MARFKKYNQKTPQLVVRRNAGDVLLSNDARRTGILIRGGKGSGKTRVVRAIGFQDLCQETASAVLAPNQSTKHQLLDKVHRQRPEHQAHLWPRLRVIDMSGRGRHVISCPLLVRHNEQETLVEVAERYIQMIYRLDPDLKTAPMRGMNALAETARFTAIVLAGMGYQLTEALDLLTNTVNWRQKLIMLSNRDKSYAVQQAVRFFVDIFPNMNEYKRDDKVTSFINKLYDIVLDDNSRIIYGGSYGIDWEEFAAKRLFYIFDFSRCPEYRKRFAMLSVFLSFMDFVEWRGAKGREQWISFIADELSVMAPKDSTFVQDINRLIDVIGRNYGVYTTVTWQEDHQLDEDVLNSLYTGCTTWFIGATQDPKSALAMADRTHRFKSDWVRKTENVYGIHSYSYSDNPPGFLAEWHGGSSYSESHSVKIDEKTTEFTLEEQLRIISEIYMHELEPLQFVLKMAPKEGSRKSIIRRISIEEYDRGCWPDPYMMEKVEASLLKATGRPRAVVLKEIEDRIGDRLFDDKPPSDTIKRGKKSVPVETAEEPKQTRFTDITDADRPTRDGTEDADEAFA